MHKAKFRRAVGLKYEINKAEAPQINVKGENLNADEIVKIARRFGVPIVENGPLAETLSKIKLDNQIPAELYEAVAILLHQIKKIDK